MDKKNLNRATVNTIRNHLFYDTRFLNSKNCLCCTNNFVLYFSVQQIAALQTCFAKESDLTSKESIWNLKTNNIQQPVLGEMGPHSCPNCGKIYAWRKSLTRHLFWECGRKPNQQCPYCPHVTSHRSDLQRHVIRKHREVLEAFSCFE